MQHTRLEKFTVWFDHSDEFHLIKNEVFTHDVYYTELDSPIIIDAGAHIGLATLYFKKIYPHSKIWAVEPLTENFVLLEKNCQENILEDVTCIQAALTGAGSEVVLYQDSSPQRWFSTAGTSEHAWNGSQNLTYPITVPALQLSELITDISQPINLIKMDIEGSELEVLQQAKDQLEVVNELLIEFHPNAQQSLKEILQLLQAHHFSVELWKDGHSVPLQSARGLLYIQARKKE